MKLRDHAFAIKEKEDDKDLEKCDTCGRIKLIECICRSRSQSFPTFRVVVLPVTLRHPVR